MHSRSTLLIFMLILGLGACSTSTTLDNAGGKEGKLINLVCDAHDREVNADPTLDAPAKAEAIADSMLLREAFNGVEEPDAVPIFDRAMRVTQRLDSYVDKSTAIDPEFKRLMRDSTWNIRRTLHAAVRKPFAESRPAKKV